MHILNLSIFKLKYLTGIRLRKHRHLPTPENTHVMCNGKLPFVHYVFTLVRVTNSLIKLSHTARECWELLITLIVLTLSLKVSIIHCIWYMCVNFPKQVSRPSKANIGTLLFQSRIFRVKYNILTTSHKSWNVTRKSGIRSNSIW